MKTQFVLSYLNIFLLCIKELSLYIWIWMSAYIWKFCLQALWWVASVYICAASSYMWRSKVGLHCTFFQDYFPPLVFEPRSLMKPKVHTLGISGWPMSSGNLPISTSPNAGGAGTYHHTQLSLHWFKGSKFSSLHLESKHFNNWALSLKNKILKWFRNLLEGRYRKVMKYVHNS